MEPIEIANVSWDCQIWTRAAGQVAAGDSSGSCCMGWWSAALWTSFVVTTVVGNAFLVAVIHYERFTGDPQKRSLQRS